MGQLGIRRDPPPLLGPGPKFTQIFQRGPSLSNDQEVIKVTLVDVDLLSIVDMIAMQYITSPHVE